MDLVKNWYSNLIINWRDAIQDEGFRRYFFPNFVVCLALYYSVIYWLNLNSERQGMIINDPLYRILSPHDFSMLIFFFTYSSTVLLLLNIAQYPYLIHRGFMTFVAVFGVRAVCIYLVPLSPSPGIIPLNDPITDSLAHESHIMNDLFFSGHVADLSTFYLLCTSARLKRYILASICIVATLLVWQRVHYTIDVMMAPLFAYLSYWVFVEKDIIWRAFLRKPQFEQS